MGKSSQPKGSPEPIDARGESPKVEDEGFGGLRSVRGSPRFSLAPAVHSFWRRSPSPAVAGASPRSAVGVLQDVPRGPSAHGLPLSLSPGSARGGVRALVSRDRAGWAPPTPAIYIPPLRRPGKPRPAMVAGTRGGPQVHSEGRRLCACAAGRQPDASRHLPNRGWSASYET